MSRIAVIVVVEDANGVDITHYHERPLMVGDDIGRSIQRAAFDAGEAASKRWWAKMIRGNRA